MVLLSYVDIFCMQWINFEAGCLIPMHQKWCTAECCYRPRLSVITALATAHWSQIWRLPAWVRRTIYSTPLPLPKKTMRPEKWPVMWWCCYRNPTKSSASPNPPLFAHRSQLWVVEIHILLHLRWNIGIRSPLPSIARRLPWQIRSDPAVENTKWCDEALHCEGSVGGICSALALVSIFGQCRKAASLNWMWYFFFLAMFSYQRWRSPASLWCWK